MRRFFFHIHEDQVFDDDESGTLLQDEAAAKAHARQVIRELKASDDFDDADWMITVKDETGTEVATIAFKDVA